jgi:hypothetical protein
LILGAQKFLDQIRKLIIAAELLSINLQKLLKTNLVLSVLISGALDASYINFFLEDGYNNYVALTTYIKIL